MKTWEINEWCQNCERENSIQWNTETMGYVATCQHCGEKLMFCDECQHEYDAEKDEFVFVDNCDWCGDAGGVCFRDTSPVELSTYGHYEENGDVQYILNFVIPKNWLRKYVKKNGWDSIDQLLIVYIWDDTMNIYNAAKKDNVIIKEWEV